MNQLTELLETKLKLIEKFALATKLAIKVISENQVERFTILINGRGKIIEDIKNLDILIEEQFQKNSNEAFAEDSKVKDCLSRQEFLIKHQWQLELLLGEQVEKAKQFIELEMTKLKKGRQGLLSYKKVAQDLE